PRWTRRRAGNGSRPRFSTATATPPPRACRSSSALAVNVDACSSTTRASTRSEDRRPHVTRVHSVGAEVRTNPLVCCLDPSCSARRRKRENRPFLVIFELGIPAANELGRHVEASPDLDQDLVGGGGGRGERPRGGQRVGERRVLVGR